MRLSISSAILFFSCFCFFYADAQTEGKVIFNLPDAYMLPREDQPILQDSKSQPSQISWVVYSDRDNNTTYTTSDITSAKFKTANFLDPFYVIDEKDNLLHIFKKSWSAVQPGKKHKSDKEVKAGFDDLDYGWIPKDKLLLWPASLVNEFKFSIKALPVLKDAAAFKEPEKYIKKGGTVYIYNAPDGTKPNDNAVKMFQFLYVYKYENKKALIGKSPTVGEAESSILGWIDTGIVQMWHLSICIWPNSNDAAILERKQSKVTASLFVKPDDAKSWSNSGTPEPVWNQDPFQSPVLADVKRMPILHTDANNVITTGNVTAVLEQSGEKIQDVNDKAELDARQGKLRQNIRTINLVFVIDGSPGFQNYFPNIEQGIRDIATNQNRAVSSDYKNHINYSAVIYRNGKDAGCPNGDMTTSVMPAFTQSWGDVGTFLETQSKISGCTTDEAGPEAMYTGLEKGLRKFSDQKDNQSNIIVLIGGAGDVTNKDKEKQLMGMVSDYKAGVIAYQLSHQTQGCYTDFKSQLDRIIKGGNTIVADGLKKSNSVEAQKLNGGNWCNWDEQSTGTSGETRYFLHYPDLSPLQGAIIYPSIKKSMQPEEMPAVINQVMDTTDHIIEQNLERFSASLTGVGDKKEIKLNPTLLMYFNALGENGGTTSKDVINKYIEGGYQFFITGYTTTTVSKLTYPIFSYVIFASTTEYESLEAAYRNLAINSATSGELRTALFDAMNQIVITYIGDKRAKEEIKKMTADELQQLITGFSSTNKNLKKHSIYDYQDSKKVTDEEVKELEQHFEDVDARLRKIRSDPNFEFKQGDDYFYWLPDYLLN